MSQTSALAEAGFQLPDDPKSEERERALRTFAVEQAIKSGFSSDPARVLEYASKIVAFIKAK